MPARARASRLGALVFLLAALALLVVTVVLDHRTQDAHQLTVAALAPSTTTRAPTTESVVRTTTTVAPTTTVPPTTTPPPPVTTTPATAPPVTTAPAPDLLVTRIGGIGSAQQVIAVATNGYGTSAATVTAYERGASGWRQEFGPWFAYVGRNGVAPYGEKREGDGRTPSGVYGFDFMFGVEADPGTHYPYRRITGSNIVWDDDSNSANYNRWIDTNTASAGIGPEPMYNTPSYDYGAVIAYNAARTPGLGSAIFLHVSHGSSTAGCVALPTGELLSLLRWLDPGRAPVIAIGTQSSLSS